MRLPRRGDTVLVVRSDSGRTVCRVRLRKDEYEQLQRTCWLRGISVQELLTEAIKNLAK